MQRLPSMQHETIVGQCDPFEIMGFNCADLFCPNDTLLFQLLYQLRPKCVRYIYLKSAWNVVPMATVCKQLAQCELELPTPSR